MEKNNYVFEGIRIEGLGLYLQKSKVFVIADLHLGYEEMLNSQGVMMPRFNYKETLQALKKVLSKLKVSRIVINGDLKHEFGRISDQEWKEVVDMLRFLRTKCGEVVLVRGNHDNVLGPIANWERVRVEDEVWISEEKVLIVHGHKKVDSGKFKSEHFGDAKAVIVAHDHPAVTLREGMKAEKYKCFLRGGYKGKKLIVMPSLNRVHIGSEVSKERLLSPMLKGSLADFDAWVVEDRPYYFGKLESLG